MSRKNIKQQQNRNQQELTKLQEEKKQLQAKIISLEEEIASWKSLEAELEVREQKVTTKLQEIENDEKTVRQQIFESLKIQITEETIAQIQQSNQETIQNAQIQAQEIIEQVKKQANIDKEKILSDAYEEGLQKIKDDESQIRAEYFNALEIQAKQNAENILQEANLERQNILDNARKESERERQSIIQNAQKQAIIEVDNIHTEKRNEMELRQKELSKREELLNQRESLLDRRQQRLQVMESDIEAEWKQIKKELERLQTVWGQCSPEGSRLLGEKVRILEQYSEADKKTIEALKDENTRLRRLLPTDETRSGQKIIEELEDEKKRNRELADQLANYPSPEGIDRLKREAEEAKNIREKYEVLQSQFSELKIRKSRCEFGNRELEQMKLQSDALHVLNEELKKELKLHKETLEERTGERFPELVQIDSEKIENPVAMSLSGKFELSDLVRRVRSYAATREIPLFYSEEDVCAFIAGLAASRLSILQGLSGTGKTSLPEIFAQAIGAHCRIIPVQSSWRDRHELLGYNNEFHKRFNETEFTKAVYTAGLLSQEDVVWVIVLDEVNLSRIEYYFADFISILEKTNRDEWVVPLMSYDPRTQKEGGPQRLINGHKLKISENLWFVGTANQDESTFEITDKVYDRAQVLEFIERQKSFKLENVDIQPVYVSLTRLQRLFKDAQENPKAILTEDDWKKIKDIDAYMTKQFEITFANRIESQMKLFVPVYAVARGLKKGVKDEAIDFLFTRKVLRKLEKRYDPNLIEELENLKREISNKMLALRSITWINRKIRKLGGTPA